MDNYSGTAVALGSFDGLHKGHMSVISSAASFAGQGLRPVVLLFDVHPGAVISGKAPSLLLQNELRDALLREAGVEPETISFSSIRSMSCEEFVSNILIGKLNAKALCCGGNYRFGVNGSGTPEDLRRLCAASKVELSVSDSVDYLGEPISSTRIRSAVESGSIRKANAMLGRPFTYKYTVVSGDRRGRLIGAPTINQHFDPAFTVPKAGVYASVTVVDGKEYISVTNIGIRPSFNGDDFRSETCILDFSADVYGRDIQVCLLDYLRPERKFDSIALLSRQISADAVTARQIFKSRGENGCV